MCVVGDVVCVDEVCVNLEIDEGDAAIGTRTGRSRTARRVNVSVSVMWDLVLNDELMMLFFVVLIGFVCVWEVMVVVSDAARR